MTDSAEKNEPSASNASCDSHKDDNSVPKGVLPDEEGPGLVGVGLSWTKSRIRDLDTDKTIPREERDLLRLYYTREREKLQQKLRAFAEAEKIKALESAIRPNDEAEKARSKRSFSEEALVKARSELKKASTALEHLCRDDASWEKQGASARRWQESRTWQAITPEELQPAVEAIRHKIEHYGFWQSNQSTMKLCFAALHPGSNTNSGRAGREGLAPYTRFLVGLLGQRIEQLLSGSDRPAPVIFKSYLDVLETAMKAVIRAGFHEMFEIAKARNDVLGLHPVEWTKRQLGILISAEKSGIRLWIKQVCDPLDYSNAASRDDSFYWGSWRAPRLIHMKPSGNTPYEQAGEWAREELVRSEELLEGLAERVTVFSGNRAGRGRACSSHRIRQTGQSSNTDSETGGEQQRNSKTKYTHCGRRNTAARCLAGPSRNLQGVGRRRTETRTAQHWGSMAPRLCGLQGQDHCVWTMASQRRGE